MKGLSFTITRFIVCYSLLCIATVSPALDTLTATQSLTGNQTLVSANENFELGFFRPDNSESRYLGIWFKKPYPITVVWVANKETFFSNNSSAALRLTDHGILILSENKTEIWSSKKSRSVKNPVAQLLSTGNLVVRDETDNDPENFLWQSFDYPSNTLLPGVKLGRDRVTGLNRFVTSWKSLNDPSPGNFTYGVLSSGYPQVVVLHGSDIKVRIGPWNGLKFSGTPNLRANPIYEFGFVFNDKEIYYSYQMLNSSVLSRTVLRPQGVLERYMWVDPIKGWTLYLSIPIDNCDAYALCGAYGSCNVDNTPTCQCMSGFEPKFSEEWDRVDWSSGCVRRAPLNCSDDDAFLKFSGLKLPDTQKSWFNTTMNLNECMRKCEKNCSCTAYANLDVREGGRGCLLWFGDLLDIREHNNELDQDIYIRMAASEAVKSFGQKNKKKVQIIVILVLTVLFLLGLGLIIYVMCKKKLLSSHDAGDFKTKIQKENLELPLFDFATLATATNNFSTENKLGEGGFGPVYKGILKENQEIAVKRLAKDSNQGLDEFTNEVICIAKLQHRNLVKLMGCCIQEEKMLVYEYMPNKSLDFFIFGLLYLHHDSRLRIVHRDLKASNVLLDGEMNPKISDFGLARSFGGNESKTKTKRVVGTYGYMSPGYAIAGIFSRKSDVFSFGILVLEIVTGKKNRGFYHPDHYHNLLGHAWKLFKEGKSLDLIDEYPENSCNLSEMLRSIHVPLLCVQRSPEERPSMPNVVLMLATDNALPEPKEPGFFTEKDVFEAEVSARDENEACSVNGITQTMLSAR